MDWMADFDMYEALQENIKNRQASLSSGAVGQNKPKISCAQIRGCAISNWFFS